MTGARAVAALYTAAISLAAALLFLVQPMVGKMVLPRAGGSPQVWNTSLVFFQTALLLGYLYAHLSARWLGVRRQAALHLVLLALPLLVLPVVLPPGTPEAGSGPIWILAVLTSAVGAPFVVLAAASPLLQRWLASTDHPDAADPYFLYAGSNAGSLVGLLAFPLVLEPLVPLSEQSRLWTAGYVGFAALALLCAVVVLRSASAATPAGGSAGPLAGPPAAADGPAVAGAAPSARPVSGRDRLFWLAAAAVPSALLLGVTQYLTTLIAPFSLLWALPLAVYLLTFIAAFARRRPFSIPLLSRLLAIATVIVALTLLARLVDPAWAVTLLHLGLLGLAALL
ncbi:MAG TPA: hypothetical protein VFQ22_02400, partial [Longimicrobiales bacterium]|nr:hypothetical protein [Longimicrobiales bacterium]